MEHAMQSLEEMAHEHHALLSSDALRYFITQVKDATKRDAILPRVIATVKSQFPSEDGWVVLNLSRMESALASIIEVSTTSREKAQDTGFVSLSHGSLAEAILGRRFEAALELIENRPMVALAEAAAELDQVHGHMAEGTDPESTASPMLRSLAAIHGRERIAKVIRSLGTALDGTYTNERDAVTEAIKRAIEELD